MPAHNRNTELLMNPVGARNVERGPIAPRLETLSGTTIGLLDNTKKNADILLKTVGEILIREHGVVAVISRRKVSSSPAAPDAMLDELAEKCAAVINAYGDCGSCASWCIFDGVTLEKRGVPTATVNSDAFVVLGQHEAIALGLPGLPIVTVPHPMGDVPADEVRKRAEAMIAQVLRVLTTEAEVLESEYTDRFIDESDKFTRSEMVCQL
ncbi:MAG: UGSC family (seleno)protein [Novosphingobium sp.]